MSQQPPQYAPAAQPPQGVAPQTTPPVLPKLDEKTRPIPGVRFFSIATITIAFLMCMLGIVAIVIEARDSYVGNAIWTGVVFVLPTGILGLATYWKRNSVCLNVFYLISSIFTCLVCGHLVVYGSINAVNEQFGYYYPTTDCDPWPGFQSWYRTSEYYEPCPFSSEGRITVDSLIVVLAFIQLVLTILSSSCTCYGTCMCCYRCCRPAPPPAVIQYTAQNGQCQLVSVGGYQAPGGGYQPVSLMMVQQAPGQGAQVVTPNMNVPGAQPQQVFVPAGSYPQGTTYIQQPVAGTPANFVNPATMMVPPPSAPASTAAVAAPTYTEQDEKKTAPAPSPSDTAQHEPNRDAPAVAVSYGQTASDEFHDEKNLLETV